MSIVTSWGRGWDGLLRVWRELKVPEGRRAEVLAGDISMPPPPDDAHHEIVELVSKALRAQLPGGCGVYSELGIEVPGLDSLYLPELTVAQGKEPLPDGHGHSVPAEAVLLAVEVMLPSYPGRDRLERLHGCAHAGVPVYLQIDRYAEEGPSVTVHTDPSPADRGVGHYCCRARGPFGAPVELPEPIGLTLATDGFPA